MEEQDNPLETTVRSEPNSDEIRQEHAQSRSLVDKIELQLHQSGHKVSAENAREVIREDKKLQESGLDLENVPEFIKPLYVQAVNLFKNPQNRLKSKQNQLDELARELVDVEKAIRDTIYGQNYNGSRGKLGGLHQEYMNYANERVECATGITSLGTEISDTYVRIKSTQTTLANKIKEKDFEGAKQLQNDLVGFKFDLQKYGGIKKQLEIRIESLDNTISSYKDNVKTLDRLHGYVQQERMQVESIINDTAYKSKEWNYADKVAEIISSMQGKVNEVMGMAKDFHEHMYKKIDQTIQLTEHTLDVPQEEHQSNPLLQLDAKNDARSDRTAKRVKEILENPFEDVYDYKDV